MTETTRQLYLMRHAHAARPASLSDKARPLDDRGVGQARRIGLELAAAGIERVLASAAIRTQQTAARLDLGVPVEPVEAFYYGDCDTMLDRLRTLDAAWTRVLVVGHNPSIAYLAHDLADPSGSDPKALALIASQFPTAACCRFDFEGPWSDLTRARLVRTWLPPHGG